MAGGGAERRVMRMRKRLIYANYEATPLTCMAYREVRAFALLLTL
eukprot:SAG11_NODE_19887_length_457_cov_0.717877_1_plen_44_part_10